MGFVGYTDVIAEGDTAIVYLGYNAMMHLKLCHGALTQTKRGGLRHSDIIGKKYGCRISTLSDKVRVAVCLKSLHCMVVVGEQL